MKKILFIATAAAMIAGCAKVTTVDTGEPQEIAFEAYYYGTTKAPLDNSAEFPTDWNMLVHALYDGDAESLHYFGESGTSFTYGSGVWHDATTMRYWPATGTLTFNAVAPTATIEGATSFSDVAFNHDSGYDLNYITATLADNSSNQTDVLVAKTAKSGKIQGDLPMTFKHALAQVVFKAATVDDSQTITIKKAVLKGSFQEGSMTATPSESDVTFVWNTAGKTAKDDMSVYGDTGQQLKTTATEVGDPVLVVPMEALDDTQLLELTYDITYPGGEASMTDVVATVALKVDGEAPGTAWEAGKKYIYTLTFSGPREITIDPDVEDWVDQEVEVPGL